jgi:hypothetical protein
MLISVNRFYFGDKFTIGKLFLEDEYICYTLEDKVREVRDANVSEWKVNKHTAIPMGKYLVTLTKSRRFGIYLPLIHNVKGFTGVRIHKGNTSANTEGCLLVGMTWNGSADFVGSSAIAFEKLMSKIDWSKEIWLEIR